MNQLHHDVPPGGGLVPALGAAPNGSASGCRTGRAVKVANG